MNARQKSIRRTTTDLLYITSSVECLIFLIVGEVWWAIFFLCDYEEQFVMIASNTLRKLDSLYSFHVSY